MAAKVSLNTHVGTEFVAVYRPVADRSKGGGLPDGRAQDVAEVLLEGDLLGHTTHGYALLPGYLKALSDGTMEKEGEPDTIPDANAEKPDDWDTEMDGEWEAPLVDNPACQSAPGCGRWTKPTIDNPKYKGKWSAPLINNPR